MTGVMPWTAPGFSGISAGGRRKAIESGIRKTVLWYLENQDWVAATVGGDYQNWIRKQYR